MNGKKISLFSAALGLLFQLSSASVSAQVPSSGYGNPFADDEDAQANQVPVYNGLSDAASQLFGPEQYRSLNAAPPPPPVWQDFNGLDPNGAYSNAYSDTARQRIEAVVNAPLPKKKPFSDPLDDIKKDPEATGLFGPQPSR